jgi:outer membrane protein insertion porin family
LRYVSHLVLVMCLVPLSAPAQKCENAESSRILVRELELVGVEELSQSETQMLIKDLTSRCYEADNLGELGERIRMFFQDRGYFKVTTGLPETKIVNELPDLTEIAVRVRVDKGRLYRLGEVRWMNVKAVDVSELIGLIPLRSGEIFSRSAVAKGLENVRRLYSSRGYINFIVVPDPYFDEQNGLISLIMDVDEGPQYRMGTVSFIGLPAELLPTAAAN